MSRQDTSELERALERTLPDLVAPPSGALLERTLRQVAATPQRTTRAIRMPRLSTRAGWSSLMVAAAAAVAGSVVGGSAVLLIANRPAGPAPPASAPLSASAPPSGSATAEPTSSDGQTAGGVWQRVEMPDPAVGTFGGGLPQDVIALDGEYIVVGSLRAFCGSDIHAPPPDCAATLSELTSDPQLQSAVVWTSRDGLRWDLLPHQAAFDYGEMHHAATDGSRIVVTGQVFEPPITLGQPPGRPVVWVSDDGRTWELVDTGEAVPEYVASTAEGFVGARNTPDGPRFFASDDGRTWEATTGDGDQGLGEVSDMAVGQDGQMVVAVGYLEVSNSQGTLDASTAIAWRSPDGRSWERAPDQDAFVVDVIGGTHMFAVAATATGWVALGSAPNDGAYDSGAWTSPDGIRWTRIPALASPTGRDAHPSAMTWTGAELVAIGSISGPESSVGAMWTSPDGTDWSLVDQLILGDGGQTAVIADSAIVLAVGAETAADHSVGVAWVRSR